VSTVGRTGSDASGGEAFLVAAELALAGVTAAVVVGFGRIFTGWGFLGPLALAAVASHAISVAARRLGLGVLTAQLLSVVGLAVVGSIVFYSSTTNHGVPTGRTWDAFTTELSDAWQRFDQVVAPVASRGGYLVAAFVAIWLSAHLADSFAFRARALVESLVPPGLVFVFCSALATHRLRLVSAGLFLASALAYALVFTAYRRQGTGTWLSSHRQGTAGALLAGGSVLGLAAVVIGLVLGPALPGARASGLVHLQGAGGGATRITPSPLVDIRGRLTNTGTVEVFSVKAARPSYWRLTSLDIFNGTIWYSENSYSSTSGHLADPAPGVKVDQLDQEYTIAALGSVWLPAAFSPAYVSGAKHVAFDAGSATLLTNDPTTDGQRYKVASALPSLSPEVLRTGTPAPDAIAKRYLQLPPDFPPDLQTRAEAITAGAVTTYDKARALQDWFRSNFTYDLSVRLGHSTSAIEEFLAVRRGYCEQFAGAYAALARSIGIPARVAVGYTPGDHDATTGVFHVLGKYAHAWPEVYIGGIGWVPFEPTPGRGEPGAEGYTGVTAQQAGADNSSPETVPTVATTTSPTTAAGSTKRTAPNETDPLPNLSGSGSLTGRGSGASSWPRRLLTALAVLAAAAAAWPVVMAGAWSLRRRRRWRHAHNDTARVVATWDEALDTVALAGVQAARGETRSEFAGRATARLGDTVVGLVALAGSADQAAFAGEGSQPGAVDRARAALVEVRHGVRTTVARRSRWRRYLDPRTLNRDHPRHSLLATRPAARPAR